MKRLLPDSYQNENFVFKWSDCLFKIHAHTSYKKKHTSTLASMRSTLNELPIHKCVHKKTNRTYHLNEYKDVCTFCMFPYISFIFLFCHLNFCVGKKAFYTIQYVHTRTKICVYMCVYHEATQPHTCTHMKNKTRSEEKKSAP